MRLLYKRYTNWSGTERELFELMTKAVMLRTSWKSFQDLLRAFDRNDTWEEMTPARDSTAYQQCLNDLRGIVDDDPSGYLSEYKVALAQKGWKRSERTIARMIKSPVKCGGLGYTLQALQYKAWQKSYDERVHFLQTIKYVPAALHAQHSVKIDPLLVLVQAS